ncbi:serine hydrolase domain-containing protein [Corallococcus llansteffanensis]|uniref:Class A beta-lactamase-related serine hydrolase n=1 Tax=Corallococcus llansteffanensis TaxID=2316731 RepID=A0A3A8N7M0_9BACT|nr:serine hydrolase domain-containing protein [Corallococcus llansteffanensis]RKH40417.1 class A beta-lactamase-related serine hydrolase [Corallococcus llansteffanensis]
MPTPSELLLAETRRYLRGYRSASLCAGLTLQGAHLVQGLRGKGPPPREDAVFSLGALTEVFTAALLAVMVGRQDLRLDTPLSELIPRALLVDEVAGRITLEQLATHTSGLPHLPPNLGAAAQNPEDPFGRYSAGLFGEFLRGYHPERPSPRPPAESFLGMGVLGHALSRRAGLNYGHALRDLLCKPLGMVDTTARVSDEQAPRLLSGHTARGRPVAPWTFPALPGAGALHSTAGDLLRFLDANLGRGEPGLVRALKLTHAPRVDSGRVRWGLGWNVSQVRGHAVVWRSSVMGGFVGFLGFAPAADVGVVLLADHGWSLFAALRGRVPLEAPGLAILSRLLPLP